MTAESKRKENNQLFWIVFIIIMCFAVFLGAYLYFRGETGFEYAGLEWQIIREGDLVFYNASVLISPPVTANDLVYKMYFRNDPRENNITVLAHFLFNKNVVISYNPNTDSCSGEVGMGGVKLGEFMAALNRNVTAAVTDPEVARTLNVSFANCSNASEELSVIVVEKSNIPVITQSHFCYIISVGNCSNTKAVERFITAAIAEAKGVKLE